MNAESELVEFVTGLGAADVPDEARQSVHRIVLSTLATGIAGAGEDGIDELRRLLVDRGGRPEATSLVFGDRLPASATALLNGTMCRALDFCDAMAPGVHVGSSVVPAAIAAAELAGGRSGAELFIAVAVGAEVGARFNLTEEMYDGFDPTGIAAVFGATAAAARVMGLDGATTLHALALAFNRCGGSFQSNIDGSLAVRLQQGLVAETGVECAQFAAAGITGPVNFLEGRYGFTHLYARGLAAPGDFVAGLGTRWLMNDFMYKRYPSCGVTQGVTRQALDVTDELDLQPDDVARVVVRMPPYSHRLVGNPFTPGANPRVSAQFSVQYCVASAITRRSATLAHFRPEMVLAPELVPLMARIEVLADPSMDARGHSSVDLELVTVDGRHTARGYDVSPGYPGNALSPAEHRERFLECMAYAPHPPSPDRVDELVGVVDQLEAMADVGQLIELVTTA